jgi:hypothetical protein
LTPEFEKKPLTKNSVSTYRIILKSSESAQVGNCTAPPEINGANLFIPEPNAALDRFDKTTIDIVDAAGHI